MKAKSIFSALAVKAEVAERDGGSGEAGRRAARGSHQKLPGALGHFGPGVHWNTGSLNLRQGSTLPLHTSQKYFFQAINYYTSTLHPGSGEPLERGCKNQSAFTTFTLAEPLLFIYIARNLKMPYLSQGHRYLPKNDMTLITAIFFLKLAQARAYRVNFPPGSRRHPRQPGGPSCQERFF